VYDFFCFFFNDLHPHAPLESEEFPTFPFRSARASGVNVIRGCVGMVQNSRGRGQSFANP
jgi:hypothetical protein